MTKDLWPEEECWPGEQLAGAFQPALSGKGQIREIHQGLEEPEAAFQARLATARASEHPEALWIVVQRE